MFNVYQSGSNILAYIKLTNFCNVGCEHCYLPESVRANKHAMSEETLIETLELIAKMAISQKSQSIFILWHGGEPLTLPIEYFKNAFTIVDEHIAKIQEKTNIGYSEGIQTSLIPFREEWVDIVKTRWSSHIGASIDFSSRKLNGSVENYHNLFMKKVELARDHGITVTPGIVPSKSENGKAAEINRWMIERDFYEYNIDRYNSYGQYLTDKPSNYEHSMFLIDLFDDIMIRMDGLSSVPFNNVIAAALKGVLYDMPGDRWGGRCQSDFLVVNPDGTTNNCPDKISFDESFSNVSSGYDGFRNSKMRRDSIRIQEISHKKDHCSTCENNTWCKSGCPITPNGPSEGEVECSGYKLFINHIRSYIEKGGLSNCEKYVS
jgi:radical SAM protein with 4Fe4S-binding SPASM domain